MFDPRFTPGARWCRKSTHRVTSAGNGCRAGLSRHAFDLLSAHESAYGPGRRTPPTSRGSSSSRAERGRGLYGPGLSREGRDLRPGLDSHGCRIHRVDALTMEGALLLPARAAEGVPPVTRVQLSRNRNPAERNAQDHEKVTTRSKTHPCRSMRSCHARGRQLQEAA